MPVMPTFSSREVQNRFGAVMDMAKKEPVTVTQYGREAVMIVPTAIGKEAIRLYNASRFAEFMKAMPPVKAGAPELTSEEITRLVHELRP
jgi:prevent-host-death family protein